LLCTRISATLGCNYHGPALTVFATHIRIYTGYLFYLFLPHSSLTSNSMATREGKAVWQLQPEACSTNTCA